MLHFLPNKRPARCLTGMGLAGPSGVPLQMSNAEAFLDIYPIGNHYYNCCLSSNILNLKSRFRERGKKIVGLIKKLGTREREPRISIWSLLERKKGWAAGWRVGERSSKIIKRGDSFHHIPVGS